MNESYTHKSIAELLSENKKLRKAISHLIPWAGCVGDGPSWATPEARKRNLEMCEEAIRDALECFPKEYDGKDEDESSHIIHGELVN